jgi:hypothetical protein
MSMKSKIKKKWLKALRSGDYKQTIGALKRQRGAAGNAAYCCLGVLIVCQGAKPEDVCATVHTSFVPNNYRGGLTLAEMTVLSQKNDGTNGHKSHTFEQIADYIEEKL